MSEPTFYMAIKHGAVTLWAAADDEMPGADGFPLRRLWPIPPPMMEVVEWRDRVESNHGKLKAIDARAPQDSRGEPDSILRLSGGYKGVRFGEEAIPEEIEASVLFDAIRLGWNEAKHGSPPADSRGEGREPDNRLQQVIEQCDSLERIGNDGSDVGRVLAEAAKLIREVATGEVDSLEESVRRIDALYFGTRPPESTEPSTEGVKDATD